MALLVLGILLCLAGAAVLGVHAVLSTFGSLEFLGIPIWQIGSGVVVLGILTIVWSRLMKVRVAAAR
jgi:hypothetical protein